MKRKISLLVLLGAGYTLALGLNCIPNIANGLAIPGLTLPNAG